MNHEQIYPHLLKSGLWPAHALSALQITSLSSGTNEVFLVSDKIKQYVIKIPKAAARDLVNRQSEYVVSQMTATAGINLAFCYFDLDSGINITPYQQNSRILTAELLQQDFIWQTAADLLRHLHHHLNQKFPQNTHIFAVIEFYQQQAADKIPPDLSGLLAWDHTLNRLREEFATMSIPMRPCHNDPILSNFLLTATHKIYLIDWEYAGNNDPCWDLANFITDAQLTLLPEQQFLTHYFQRPSEPAELRRIAVYKVLSNYLWTLWCIVMGDSPNAYRRFSRFQTEINKIL
jgi:thiamine kinase-like enzyme